MAGLCDVSGFAQTPTANQPLLILKAENGAAERCHGRCKRYRVNVADRLLAAKSRQTVTAPCLFLSPTPGNSLAIQKEAIDLLRALEASPARMISAMRNPH
jgi:hypothetical protein